MKIEEPSAILYRRRAVLLANLLLAGFIFGPRRSLSPPQRVLTAAAWTVCRGALVHGVMFPNSAVLGAVIHHFRPDGREVWLTLDDGPDPRSTPALLDLLGEFNALATFFVIGRKVKAHPDLALAVAEAGHHLGNHTHTHPSVTLWGAFPSRLRAEVREASRAIREATGVVPTFFRSPAGVSSPLLHAVLGQEGLRRVGWSARGFDGFERFAQRSIDRTMQSVRPGAILLFHGEGRTAASGPARLRRLLQRLSEEGYRCVLPSIKAPGM